MEARQLVRSSQVSQQHDKHDTDLLENLLNIERIKLTTGGTVFDLQNGGGQTCAVKFQQELVVIGGKGDTTHGKVDR